MIIIIVIIITGAEGCRCFVVVLFDAKYLLGEHYYVGELKSQLLQIVLEGTGQWASSLLIDVKADIFRPWIFR